MLDIFLRNRDANRKGLKISLSTTPYFLFILGEWLQYANGVPHSIITFGVSQHNLSLKKAGRDFLYTEYIYLI